MVDSGSIHPETVIDLARRQRERKAGQHLPASEVPEMTGDFLALPFLMGRLESTSEQVRMWAAYQMVDRWLDESERYIDRLFGSPTVEIRESAINLIGRFKLNRFAFPLLGLFKMDPDGLRSAAAHALAQLQYEPAGKPLAAWLQTMMAQKEQPPAALESAVQSLLVFDNQRYWNEVCTNLEDSLQNHSVYAVLFRLLCESSQTDAQASRLAGAYRQSRKVFNDIHLTRDLVDMVGRPSMSLYLQSRLNAGYPLPSIYHECLQVMGVDKPGTEIEAMIGRLSGCSNTRTGVVRFLPLGTALIDRLVTDPVRASRLRTFLQGCAGLVEHWEDAILKLREAEYHLLISLPLVGLLEEVEAACLENPGAEALRIARIYQSPLLSPEFMRKVLNLLADRSADPEFAALCATPFNGWLRNDEKDTLWKLFTHQLDSVEHPFSRTLPQPWAYRLPPLMERLLSQLMPRFEGYLAAGNTESVDYCLDVFRRQGGQETVTLMLRHFEALMAHHYSGFIDLITHLPDSRFLDPLLRHYREGEYDLERLIRFLCKVHDRPCPEQLQQTEEQSGTNSLPPTVRLLCPSCGKSYQYWFEALYVSLDRIEQRLVPTSRDLWSPEAIMCKKCHVPIPLEPSDDYLRDLYTELLATRILHTSPGAESQSDHVHIIPFPVLDGRTLNPSEFLLEVQHALSAGGDAAQHVPYLLELGRFYLELGNLDEARSALQKILAGPVKCPHALYYMGVIAFQEKNLYDARVYFSRLIASCGREEFENEPDNPLDMAQHYLRLMDKRDFKRSQFRIISS